MARFEIKLSPLLSNLRTLARRVWASQEVCAHLALPPGHPPRRTQTRRRCCSYHILDFCFSLSCCDPAERRKQKKRRRLTSVQQTIFINFRLHVRVLDVVSNRNTPLLIAVLLFSCHTLLLESSGRVFTLWARNLTALKFLTRGVKSWLEVMQHCSHTWYKITQTSALV